MAGIGVLTVPRGVDALDPGAGEGLAVFRTRRFGGMAAVLPPVSCDQDLKRQESSAKGGELSGMLALVDVVLRANKRRPKVGMQQADVIDVKDKEFREMRMQDQRVAESEMGCKIKLLRMQREKMEIKWIGHGSAESDENPYLSSATAWWPDSDSDSW